MSFFILFLVTLGLTILIMFLTWVWAVKIDNYGIVDAVWSFAFVVQALIFYFLSDGLSLRKNLLLIMVGLWSLRLGYYLAVRIGSHHPVEDTRYAKLREEYGVNYKNRFLRFFMIQAVSVSILTVPFIFSFNYKSTEVHFIEYFGFAFWALALIGETIADYQMNSFKNKPENKGQICNIGLWNYSRHPNYFFESCIWFGFFIFWMAQPQLIWTIYAPLIILYLLVKVTGVPPSEIQSLKTRGQKYIEYQKKTSMFIPWFPKK